MSDFNIQIKVDPSGAPATIASVMAPLDRLEAKGKTAGDAVSAGLGKARASADAAATAQRALEQALERTGTLHSELSYKSSAMASSFNSLTQAIQRERDMLESIRGPAQRAAQDQQTLNSMLERGVIDAKEYASAMKNVTPQGGGMLKGLGSQLGGMGAIGSLGMGAGAVLGVKELASIDDKYTDLRNSALRFTDADHNVNQVLEDQRTLARSLHQDLGQEMEAYEKVRQSTDDVNLSYEQTLRLTKTYTEAAVLNGRSTEDLAQQMQNLSVAFEIGSDASRPLKAIFKEFPELAHQWEKSLGVTEKQLFAMGKTGQLSMEKLISASITATDTIDAKFGQRVKTWHQAWEEFKDDLERPIDINQGLADYEHSLKPFENTLARLKTDFEQLRTAAEAALSERLIGNVEHAGAAMLGLAAQTERFMGAFVQDGVKGVKAAIDPWYSLDGAASKMTHTLSSEEQLLKTIEAPMKQANELIKDSAMLYAQGAISVEQWCEQVRKAQQLAGMPTPVRSVVSGEGGDFFSPFRNQPGAGGVGPANLNEFDPNKTAELAAASYANAMKDSPEEATRKWKAEIEQYDKAIAHMKDDARTVLDPLKQAFSDLVTKGKADWSGMLDNMASNVSNKLLDKGESSLLDAVFGKTSQEFALNTSFASGGATAGGEIATAMTGAGAIVAGEIASAMAAGAAASGAAGLFGSAAGAGSASIGALGASDLPSTGAASIARGSGGFSVAPGSSFNAPGSPVVADARKGGSTSHTGHTIVNLNYDPRAIQSGKAIHEGVMAVVGNNRTAIRALLGL